MLQFVKHVAIVTVFCLINACGGGSGGGSIAGNPGSGSGTGGTGIAAVSGFSSVIMNDDRVFSTDANTQFFLDGSPISETQFTQGGFGIGLMARYEVADDVNTSISSGTLTVVNAENIVKGPVTSTNPLQVLGQNIIVTGDTVLVGLNTVANLQLGDEIEVSGYGDDANSIQATRLETKPAGIPVWKILGNVNNVVGNTSFQMGAQQVNLNGVIPTNCGAGLVNGNVVEVKADRDPGFTAGNSLATVTSIECRSLALMIPANPTGNSLEAEAEGVITSLVSASDFSIRQQRIVTTATTIFEGGKAGDVLLGARLEAEGTLDISTRVLTAEKIRFRQNRVRIEAPVNVPGSGLGANFTIMDVITVNTNALTEDDDGLVDGSGSAGNQQVEVRGFVDKTGQVFAERVRNRGNADPTKVRLRGPATDTCNPSIGDAEFGILNVIIDTSDPGTLFQDSRSTTVPLPDSTALCNLISTGTAVQAEDGTFSSPPARIDNAGLIEIED